MTITLEDKTTVENCVQVSSVNQITSASRLFYQLQGEAFPERFEKGEVRFKEIRDGEGFIKKDPRMSDVRFLGHHSFYVLTPVTAQPYTSKIIQSLLDEISPVDQAQCDARMCFQIKIYEGMKVKGLTQLQLADLMGVSKGTVYSWIKGNTDMKLSTLAKLEVILNINLLNTTV